MRSLHVTSCALPRLGTDTPRVTGPAPAGGGSPRQMGWALLRLFSGCMPPDPGVISNRFFLSSPAYGKLSNDFYVTGRNGSVTARVTGGPCNG